MSRVVVAWKPLSANASPAASISRWTASAPAARPPAPRDPAVLVMVDSMPHGPETKQALSHWRTAMPRNVYGPDHEAFRETAREFVERSLKPRAEDFLKDKAMGREVWLEAGAQGLLGLEVPEQYGGSEGGDFPLHAVLAQELSQVHPPAAPPRRPPLLRHPPRLRRAVPRRPGHGGAEAAVAARVLLRRDRHRHRDDRAER